MTNAVAGQGARWVTSAALRALARIAPAEGDTFTRDQLAEAMGEPPRSSTRKLAALQFITAQRVVQQGVAGVTYAVTAEGAAAIAAAAVGQVLTGGGTTMHAAQPGTLRWRLWSLLRVRRSLDGEEAASVLCDAGDARYVSKRGRINEYLRRWAEAEVLQLSAAKLPKGRKRYVLVNDPGPAVPPFRPLARAGKGA